jgi:hypothetical protein
MATISARSQLTDRHGSPPTRQMDMEHGMQPPPPPPQEEEEEQEAVGGTWSPPPPQHHVRDDIPRDMMET